jgi:hypothetical protein
MGAAGCAEDRGVSATVFDMQTYRRVAQESRRAAVDPR